MKILHRIAKPAAAPFTEYLGKCLSKKVVFYQVQSNAAEIEAMRSGRLHVGGFSTGPTAFAVNLAGAVPFAVKGDATEFQGYHLIVIVRKSSPFMKLSDLKGKKVAHTAPSSNSGHMAPMALFPAEGLTPDMQKAFDGADRFFPVTFQKDWAVVREVAEGSGEAFNRANYDKQTAKEAEAARKKTEEPKKP